MADFVAVPATVLPTSSKDELAGIEWAKAYADSEQAKRDDIAVEGQAVYVTALYSNLKNNQSGQILSTKYAELVKSAYGLTEIERVFLTKIATSDELQAVSDIASSAPTATTSTLTEARVLEMFAGFGVSESRAIELIAEHAPQPDGTGVSEERAIEIATDLGVSSDEAIALIAQLAPQPDGTGFSQEDILDMISMNAPSPDGVGVLEDRAIELIEARVMTQEQVSAIVMAGTPDDVTMDDVIAAIAQYGEKADGVGISNQEAVDLIDARAPSAEAFISMQAENQLLTDKLLDLEERIQFIEQPATVPVAETIGFEAYAEDVQAMIDMSNSGAGEGVATQEWVIDQLAMNSNEFEPAGISDL